MAKEFDALKALAKEKEKIERQMSAYQAACNHMNKNGEFKLDRISNDKVICKKCKTVFSRMAVTQADSKAMIETLNDLVNQLKLKSDPSDRKMCLMISQTVNTVKELVKLYNEQILNSKGKDKNKNKNKNKNRDIGGYGLDNMFN